MPRDRLEAGVHGLNRHPRPGDFAIFRYVRRARCQHKYTAEWREHRDAAEICRSGSLTISSIFFPPFLLFVQDIVCKIPFCFQSITRSSGLKCVFTSRTSLMVLLFLLSINFPSNRSDLCQSRFMQTKRLMALGYRKLAAVNEGLFKRSLVW